MFLKFFLAFTLIPLLELWLLVEVGRVIGGLSTILLVIATGIAGAWLARLQGMQTMLRVRESLARGFVPAEEMLDALLIFVAGVMLITPGLITDLFGLLVLFPPSRRVFKQWLRRKLDELSRRGTVHISRL